MAEIVIKEELLKYLQNDPPLVQSMIDSRIQVQVNGIELTLRQVERITEAGSIDFTNQERKVSRATKLEFDANGWIHLSKGYYKVLFNEIVNISKDIVALARPRSTLLRNGVTVETALWDSGYSGRSESLLIVLNTKGCNFKKNARLIQLVFFKLSKPVEKGYAGQYSKENI